MSHEQISSILPHTKNIYCCTIDGNQGVLLTEKEFIEHKEVFGFVYGYTVQ